MDIHDVLIENEHENEQLLAISSFLLLLIFYGAEEGRLRRNERRQSHRLYLRRMELLQNPRGDTPWQVLYASQSDRAFITTMGFDVATFETLLHSGFELLWNTNRIPRHDAPSRAPPRLGRRSLDAAGALGLVLHYLNSTMSEISLQQIFALIPSTVSRYVRFALGCLLEAVKNIPEGGIYWPDGEQMEHDTELICNRHPLLRGAFGSIDGLNLPVSVSSNPEVENATYSGWLHTHCVSSVFAFSPRGEI